MLHCSRVLKTGIDHYLVSASFASPAGAFLAASRSFSSLILLNFSMFSKKVGLLERVMKSFAFLLSPLEPWTAIVFVLICLKVAYSFLKIRNLVKNAKMKSLLTVQGFQKQ